MRQITNWIYAMAIAADIVFIPVSAWASVTDNCEQAQSSILPPSPLYLYEMPPYKAFGKKWSTSPQMKHYFNGQKKLFRELQQFKPDSQSTQTLRFAAVGDLMRMTETQDDFVDQAVLNHLSDKDLVFGNLETLISKRHSIPLDKLTKMNSSHSLLSGFRKPEGGNVFSALSMANNHVFDYPDDAIIDTLDFLEQEQILQSGFRRHNDEKPYVVIEKQGIRVGIYALTTFYNNAEMASNSKLLVNERLTGIEPLPVNEWKKLCELDLQSIYDVLEDMTENGVDFKVISIHWGHEHDMYPHPTQLQIAHQLVSHGADIILGSHPHVPQPAEICFINGYEKQLPTNMVSANSDSCLITTEDGKPRKALIYYSLGNFTAYSYSFWQQLGIVGEFTITKNNEGHVDWLRPQYTYTYTHQLAPPNGKRQLLLLDDYLEQKCLQDSCSAPVIRLASAAKQHLTEPGFSFTEELAVIRTTYYDSMQRISDITELLKSIINNY